MTKFNTIFESIMDNIQPEITGAYYFGNCINTVDIDHMWDATQMAQFLENQVQPISLEQVKPLLHDGDRKLPQKFFKHLLVPEEIDCFISYYQRILVVYDNIDDIHYFFDIKF